MTVNIPLSLLDTLHVIALQAGEILEVRDGDEKA